jgi:hypothetical protein
MLLEMHVQEYVLIHIRSKHTNNALGSEPQIPNEIADKNDLNQKTVQSALLELAITKKNEKLKKVGRYIFKFKKSKLLVITHYSRYKI